MTPSPPLQRFARDQLPVMPWKNGGGSTREIACWPPGAGLDDFGWRISIASIAAPGPFSVFAGVDRHIVLLDGGGVRLQSPDGAIDHRLDTPGQPFAFSGDAAVHCTLLGGASTDFNVMARRGQWQAELHVLEQAGAIAPAPHGLLLALGGAWRLGHDRSVLHTGEGLRWSGAMQPVDVQPASPGARLLAVRLHSP
ncbi:histidine utilization protein HutD [Rhodococcus sp. SRB_17]|nr:histidine utilization protein HutD [Rhodococcus sp. SRB_17]